MDLARQVYRVVLEHNDLARLSLGRVPVGPHMLRTMEWSLELARGAGIPERPSAYLGDILGRYIDASALEVTSAPTHDFAQVGEYFSNLPVDSFPNIRALYGVMFAGGADERFEFGLELLVRGIVAYVRPPRAPGRRASAR